MVGQGDSRKSRPSPETDILQSMLQQAQAAAAAQSDSAGQVNQNAPLEDTDLVTRAAEDTIPPPAYSDSYGAIHAGQDGLDTTAQVTDDGRVNIRINQLNRRLSQILTPALRQQVQGAKDSQPPPPPYIPASLGGDERAPAPPSLNIVIQVVGSRGDVQPFVALGKVLKNTYGHRVRLATHPNFEGFVEENGLEFFSIGGDPSQLMAFMVKNPALMPGFRSILTGDVRQRRIDVAQYLQGCWRSCYQAGDGLEPTDTGKGTLDTEARPFVADCIIANPPSFAHVHCAEKLGIPLHIMFTMPYSPTQTFPHPLANIQSSNADPQLSNYLSYNMIEILSWQGLGDIINRFRAKCLGLDPLSLAWAPGMLHRLKIPHTYCWSPALIPKPVDWGSHISIAGFYFLNLATDYDPPTDLKEFLNAGPTPIYIGFGSIVLDDPNAMVQMIFKAIENTGQRALVSTGWGGIGTDPRIRIPENVFILGNVPHDWLFAHVSCVVHHGGAGTTAAGIAAGRPTLIVPFFGDQPFWGAMIARAGAGPNPIHHKELTAEKLTMAINFCLKHETLQRAKDLADKIASERGSDMGAVSFHQYLEFDRLRCTLAPSRPATWRIKRTKIRLSAFAACTLANANLLNFKDLKLFRAQEYETDEGPWDPISGGFVAAFGSATDMAVGLVTIPSEAYKVAKLPFGKKSEASKPYKVTNHPDSVGQSRTSLNDHVAQDTLQIPSNRSENLSESSTGPSLLSGTSQTRSVAGEDEMSSQKGSVSSRQKDPMQKSTLSKNRGVTGMATALAKSPMDVSVGLTKGMRNMSKLWGDDTIRPSARVTDFKSGAKAAGKELGLGFYDGITGLVTQPWQGAKKEGATGFLKGVGKGFGGFFTKQSAGALGLLSYPMKGLHKEVQKAYGSNVQNYIIASRTAQGYEEWLQSSDSQKEEIITRWHLVQKYLKKKHKPEEMMRDLLEEQREGSTGVRTDNRGHSRTPSSSQTPAGNCGGLDNGNDVVRLDHTRSPIYDERTAPGNYLPASEGGERNQLHAHRRSQQLPAEADGLASTRQGDASGRQYRRPVSANHQTEEQYLREALEASKAEAQRHAQEAMDFQRRLDAAIARTRQEQAHSSSDSDQASRVGLNDEEEEEFERRMQESAATG